jgi:poly(3-hydroxybutyrate) depolymerase
MPVRLGLRNPTSQPVDLHAAIMAGTQALWQQDLHLEPGQNSDLVALVNAKGEKTLLLILNTAEEGAIPFFVAELPLPANPPKADMEIRENLAWSIRPLTTQPTSAKWAAVRLTARALGDKPVKVGGALRIRKEANMSLASLPVEIDIPTGGIAEQLIALPMEQSQPGRYRIEFSPDLIMSGSSLPGENGPDPRPVINYQPVDLEALRQLVSPAQVSAVLKKMNCPPPLPVGDLALAQARIDRLADVIVRQGAQPEADIGPEVLAAKARLDELVTDLKANGSHLARQRGWFESAVFANADDSAQPYSLFVPRSYDPARKYALFIYLHGSGGTHAGENGFDPALDADVTDRLMLNPMGRGRRCSYSELAIQDVLQQIRAVMADYNIDPDAVHISGGSMGGMGTYAVACAQPDLFASATPCCAFGNNLPMERLSNLPMFIHHGLADDTVRPAEDRFAAAHIQGSGGRAQLYLYPGATHEVFEAFSLKDFWRQLKDVRRDPQPASVVLTGPLPSQLHAYWLSVLARGDLHQEVYAKASFLGPNNLVLQTRNVRRLSVALPCKWIDPSRPVAISSSDGRQRTERTPGPGAVSLTINLGEHFSASISPTMSPANAQYAGGGARQIFADGQPVRIVYGTAGSAEQTARLAELAKSISRWSFARGSDFDAGAFPVLSDKQVLDMLAAASQSGSSAPRDLSGHLIILGSPQDNALLARLAGDLPVQQDKTGLSIRLQGGDGRLAKAEQPGMFSLVFKNPLGQGMIWWFSGVENRNDFTRLAQLTDRDAFGPCGPEFILLSPDRRVRLIAYLESDWTLSRSGPLQTQKPWASAEEMFGAYAAFLKASLGAEISLASCQNVPAGTVDFESLTLGEALAMLPHQPVFLAQPTGGQVQAWRAIRRPGRQRSSDFYLGPQIEQLVKDRPYTLLLDPTVSGDLEALGGLPKLEYVPLERIEQLRGQFARQAIAPPAAAAPASQPAGSP